MKDTLELLILTFGIGLCVVGYIKLVRAIGRSDIHVSVKPSKGAKVSVKPSKGAKVFPSSDEGRL